MQGRGGGKEGGQGVEEKGERFVHSYEMSNERVPKSTHDGQTEYEVCSLHIIFCMKSADICL